MSGLEFLLLNILIAYPYYSKDCDDSLFAFSKDESVRFFLDSGAFTAWKSGKPITVDDYCRFLESIKYKPWRYLSLDVVGDPHMSMINYELMLKRGFNPVPIFTRGEDPSVIDEMYKTTDLVAIGGLVGTKKNKGFVKGVMPFFKGRNVHLLGFVNKAVMKTIRPYSCDSSSSHSSARYGSVSIFNKKNGEWILCSRLDFASKPSPDLAELIRSYDVDPKDLAKSSNWIGLKSKALPLSFRSHIRASIAYERKLNVKYFLATNSSQYLNILKIEYDKEIMLW